MLVTELCFLAQPAAEINARRQTAVVVSRALIREFSEVLNV